MKTKKNISNTAFFTICSVNYLPTAKILISYLEQNTKDDIYLIICDEKREGIKDFFPQNKVNILFIEDLNIDGFEEFKLRYSILELNTAIKPFIFKFLLKNYKKVFYFDPDIVIENNLEKLVNCLDEHEAVVTPHLLTPYKDNHRPNLADITNSGIYNLGFLGLKRNDQNYFLEWWAEKCKYHCYNDTENGLFTDQKFCDYLPIFIKKTLVYTDCDANIAYWNLHERRITENSDGFFSNEQKVLFFHFSGLVFDNKFSFKKLSKHEGRFKHKIDEPLRRKVEDYLENLKIFSKEFSSLKISSSYGFDNYKGFLLDTFSRAYIKKINLKNIELNTSEIDKEWFYKKTTEIKELANFPRYFLGIYYARKDLQEAFNLKNTSNQNAFFQWIGNEIALGNLDNQLFTLLPKKAVNSNLKFLSRNSLFILLKRIYNLYPDFFSQAIFINIRRQLKNYLLKQNFSSKNDLNAPTKILPKFKGKKITKDGVNLFGYFNKNTGLAVGVNLMRNIIQKIKINFSAHNVNIDDNSLISPLDNNGKVWDISLFHINADQTGNFAPYLEKEHLNTYKIGYWAWELERFPSEPLTNAKFLNDIWVPSNFIADSIERSCFIRPKIIPHPVLEHDKNNFCLDTKFNFKNKFNVTGIFDLNSYIDRKNPFGILKTYQKACKDKSFQKNSHLILKISGVFNKKRAISKILSEAKKSKISLTIIDQILSSSEMESLRNSTDVFISLHRSEGFGLNIIENMNAGNIVIATNYSGNTDYMNETNSLLVDYKLIPIQEGQYPYGEGQFWAEPDINDACEKLLWAFHNRNEAQNITKKAKSFIAKNYSIQAVGKIVEREIANI